MTDEELDQRVVLPELRARARSGSEGAGMTTDEEIFARIVLLMGVSSGHMPPPPLKRRFRMHRRFGFWQVQKTVYFGPEPYGLWEPGLWEPVKSYIRKNEATAHLVKLKLQGEDVEL